MLLKSSITSAVVHTDDWFAARLGQFTSSECHYLMGETQVPVAGINYVYRKVGEELTGIPCRKEVTVEATEHGLLYENDGLRKFGEQMGIKFLVTQKAIKVADKREASTPDAIWVHGESVDKTAYKVSTVEIKCPSSFDSYINLWNCKTPADLKKVNKAYYWQVLHQLRVCGALEGYFICYQPFFKMGGLNIIEFKQIDLTPDFRVMKNRLEEAEALFIQQRNKMIV